MIRIGLDRRWRVNLTAAVDLPMPTESAWRSLCDFRRFACLDVFHRSIHLDRPEPAAGVGLRIDHRFGPFHVVRTGRILTWDEGQSYSFSDLSARGPLAGFPHVYRFALEGRGAGASRLTLGVRGRWTARLLPRLVVRTWLRWIMLETSTSVRNALLSDLLRRRTP